MAAASQEQPVVAPGWRPIETAPKDGSYILVFDEGTHDVVRWSGFRWSDEYGNGWSTPPDYWVPLLPGPTPDQKEYKK